MSQSSELAFLLTILKCPNCPSQTDLQLISAVAPAVAALVAHDCHLKCTGCASVFPITADGIPIMWSIALQQAYGSINSNASVGSGIAANVEVYDHISDNYHAYTRQHTRLRARIQRGAIEILSALPAEQPGELIHLDFGCGPGHVLTWLQELGLRRIGLDVSLQNLRNARKNAGCLVVCGDATQMPFRDHTIDLVTESSVLHHIENWRSAVRESIRICKRPGGVLIDSEPSKAQLAWSRVAVAVFDLRFVFYRMLSYVDRSKYIFRDTKRARKNLRAEVHHQPGTGFATEEVKELFESAGLSAQIICSPDAELRSCASPSWKAVLLSLLSLRNPWNPKYGPFMVIATAGLPGRSAR